ncbi:MAG: CHAT domain-containing protein [Acidobacteria bacterium]|nr:CHAT domain-containing protein [Acidobacteriota bacterium]
MANESNVSKFTGQTCISEEGLYSYISGQGEAGELARIENHLAKCAVCRRALADLLELLHPDAERSHEEIPSPSKSDLEKTLTLIRDVSRSEHKNDRKNPPWFKWAVAAAAAICFVALSGLCLKYIFEKNKSEAYFARARSMIERGYTGASPSDLRFYLPFESESINRDIAGDESLRSAENLFYQALAVREDMLEARLGLAYVSLNLSEFERSQKEFQAILNTREDYMPALIGHGIAVYERAVHGSDPVQRITLLNKALNDFDAALKRNPDSAEARYNKAWTLYECGRHKEALEQITEYLARDDESVWADKLKRLRIKIQAADLGALEKKIDEASHRRDRTVLEEIARQAPYQMPPIIWSAMRRSIQLDPAPAGENDADSEDLQWAARIIEDAYGAATGDRSFRGLLDFYAGLSPSQRAQKKILDQNFQKLVELHSDGELEEVLSQSGLLKDPYARIGDLWQLYNLHHLRGNCLYLGRDEFDGAYFEFRKMHEIAMRFESPYLIARALGSLAMICGERGKFDESLRYADEMKKLAANHNLDSWQAYACITLGNQFRRLGQYEHSLREYTNALGFANRLLTENQIVEVLESLGIVMDRLDRLSEAQTFFRLALQQLDGDYNETVQRISGTISRHRRFNLIYQQGDLALRTGDLVSAETFFEEVLNTVPSGMRELEARNCLGLAEVHFKKKNLRDAEDLVEKVLSICSSGQYPEIEWQARHLKGEILETTGHYNGAVAHFQQAIALLEQMRSSIKPVELRPTFFNDRFDPYKAMVSLLYHALGDKRKALEFVDRAKSMTLKEHLRSTGPVAGMPVKSTAYAYQQDLFRIVEYFFTEDRLLVFVTHQGSIEVASLDAPVSKLSLQIHEYLESIQENDSGAFVASARRLYNELILPIEKYVTTGRPETLVILPDGPLHLLPFAGLQDKEGRFLIERTPVAFAPSRGVFYHCLINNSVPLNNNPDVMLIDGSTDLSNAREELAYLEKLYGNNASVLGPKHLPIFSRLTTSSEIIHFAGHAVTRQGKPVLVLQKYPEEIYVDCQAINAWKIPQTKLVNLAGCSTAIGPLGEGEAPWGLIPSFLNAGASAILASLTPVDDASTKELTYQFYKQLNNGVCKVKALQNAQIALLHSARSGDGIKPQKWIPYILIGDPQ